jgi:hypothetical protein
LAPLSDTFEVKCAVELSPGWIEVGVKVTLHSTEMGSAWAAGVRTAARPPAPTVAATTVPRARRRTVVRGMREDFRFEVRIRRPTRGQTRLLLHRLPVATR